MLPPPSARWLDDRVAPTDYNDRDDLVRAARAARERYVEFEWHFNEEDLISLRRAAFEWGRNNAGRYRCFDARVLAAINTALGDSQTPYYINEPQSCAAVDSSAACIPIAGGYRLHGRATFDLVFGYASASFRPEYSYLLTENTRRVLAATVHELGWDVQRMRSDECRRGLNALYGLSLTYGIEQPVLHSGRASDVPLRFRGPFSFLDADLPCLFTDPLSSESGIYVWTITVRGQDSPWYVGQTRRSFAQRMGEHVSEYLAGKYDLYDIAALSRGEHRLVEGFQKGPWPQTIGRHLATMEHVMPRLLDFLRAIRIFVAPLEVSPTVLDQAEGALGRHFKRSSPVLVPGQRLPASMPDNPPVRFLIASDSPILGLPDELVEPAVTPMTSETEHHEVR